MSANVLEGFTVMGDSNARNLCTFVENRGVHLHKKIVKGGWTYKDLLQRARRITFETPVLIICGINDVRKIKSNSSFKANVRMLFNRLRSSRIYGSSF
ncbi:hypothetical protein FQR65_LT15648 [Abscondita terminalis]|nr:hypothetical protein FQR65_LT15648 [Abscondita terminalis]